MTDKPADVFGELAGWGRFGAGMVRINESGMTNPDIHPGNIGWSNGELKMLDYADMREIDYPDDWEQIAVSLLSLLRPLDSIRASSFRFGYLHHGGPTAGKIFEYLRHECGLSAFADEIHYRPDDREESGNGRNAGTIMESEWTSWRDEHERGDIINERDGDAFYRWFEDRDAEDPEPSYGDRYHAEAHLFRGLGTQSGMVVVEASLNLQRYFAATGEWPEAVGYALLAREYAEKISDKADGAFLTSAERVNERTLSLADSQLIEDVEDLANAVGIEWPLHWIWCVDDYKAGEIDIE